MEDSITPSQVTYNQAGFQMFRINQLMCQINLCWSNLLGQTEGVSNHQLLFDCLVAYFLEVKSEFIKTERDSVEKQLQLVEKLITARSIWTQEESPSLSGSVSHRVINEPFYFLIRTELREFQSLILSYASGHGFGNPTKSDPRRAVIEN